MNKFFYKNDANKRAIYATYFFSSLFLILGLFFSQFSGTVISRDSTEDAFSDIINESKDNSVHFCASSAFPDFAVNNSVLAYQASSAALDYGDTIKTYLTYKSERHPSILGLTATPVGYLSDGASLENYFGLSLYDSNNIGIKLSEDEIVISSGLANEIIKTGNADSYEDIVGETINFNFYGLPSVTCYRVVNIAIGGPFFNRTTVFDSSFFFFQARNEKIFSDSIIRTYFGIDADRTNTKLFIQNLDNKKGNMWSDYIISGDEASLFSVPDISSTFAIRKEAYAKNDSQLVSFSYIVSILSFALLILVFCYASAVFSIASKARFSLFLLLVCLVIYSVLSFTPFLYNGVLIITKSIYSYLFSAPFCVLCGFFFVFYSLKGSFTTEKNVRLVISKR
ncbi:MAG: hypothetical protein LKE31_02770 [Bacilli bacterium]|jgi:hypothetical protein|nr:hypothetical protein [Bacilli bacterium]